MYSCMVELVIDIQYLQYKAHTLNKSGEQYLLKYPKLGARIVDGTSLAAAVVVNSIPQGTDQVILAGNVSKVARAVAQALCKKNIKVINPLLTSDLFYSMQKDTML